jgi:GntR family transcriptional regulator
LFVLNPQSGHPIYRQLVDQVRRLVASGLLKPGDGLPSVRELALEHAINPMTISKAYGLLENEGLLKRNRGKPMTVAGSTALAPIAERRRQAAEQVRNLVLAARQLELEQGDVLALIKKHWREVDV